MMKNVKFKDDYKMIERLKSWEVWRSNDVFLGPHLRQGYLPG